MKWHMIRSLTWIYGTGKQVYAGEDIDVEYCFVFIYYTLI